MGLHVRSRLGTLCHTFTSTTVAAKVAAALTTESRSFYCEPYPDARTYIAVDPEHIARVQELIKEFS